MSADPYVWVLAGVTERDWKSIHHCYENCCHVALTRRTGARTECGPHCDDDDDWKFYNTHG